jgi:hypothetical protein
MAKTPVTLLVDGFKEREVAGISYTFAQATDKEGQTTGIPRGGKIKIKVKALNDGNCELLSWMCDKSLAKGGKIEFMNSADATKKMKDVEFNGAYCVEYLEHWEDTIKAEDLAHWEEITITCKEIINQSVTYENDWS